jgi:NAD+ kinase
MSIESLQAKLQALENEMQATKMERDMWQRKALGKQSSDEEEIASVKNLGGLDDITKKTKLSRPQSIAKLHTKSLKGSKNPGAPSTSVSANKPQTRRSTINTSAAKRGVLLRQRNSVSRMVSKNNRNEDIETSKASFDIIKCTDEVCELIKVPKGLLTTRHQDTTTAKLIWKDRPTTVLLVKKPEDTPSRNLMCRLAKYLVEEMKFSPVVVDPLVIDEINAENIDDWVKESSRYFRSYTNDEQKHLHRDIDIVITVGGDGTVLWTAQLFEGPCPPVISFSMGSMGFLTPFHADDYKVVLTNVVEKGCYLSVRSRVEGAILRDNANCNDDTTATSSTTNTSSQPHVVKHSVLNEIVVDRGPASTLGNLMSYCNGQVLTRVQADGIIIGTPTGSTAYSLSAGGSIVHPAVPSMVFTPICPHTLSFRSMIFPDSVSLKIIVPHDSRSTAWASFDGKHRTELKRGDSLSMTVSRFPVPLICKISEQSDWLESVKEQLFWNMRVVQKKKEVQSGDDQRGRVFNR